MYFISILNTFSKYLQFYSFIPSILEKVFYLPLMISSGRKSWSISEQKSQ